MKDFIKLLINNSWEVARILREVGCIIETIMDKKKGS